MNKKPSLSYPFLAWAARDAMRRPLEAGLLAAALLLTTVVVATPLLLTQTLTSNTVGILKSAPSLVVRRLGPLGWTPLPAAEAVASAESVPGVVAARPRTWGVATGPGGPLTVVGVDTVRPPLFRPPQKGEAIVGSGVAVGPGALLTLSARKTSRLRVVGRFDPRMDVVVHDIVLLHTDDARELLGMPPGHASDLAVEVFQPQEEAAVLPDLAKAFPWPVRITTRSEATGAHAAELARRGGMAAMVAVPALLSLILLVLVTLRDRHGQRFEIGLLKALGWTSADIVYLQITRALVIALPAATIGMLAAYALVYWPGVSWPASLFLGWTQPPPRFYFDPTGAALVLLEAAALVMVPYLAATFGAVLRCIVTDPLKMLERKTF